MDYHLGTLSIEIHLEYARSLKDRRAVLRSLKDRLRKHNISVAEVGPQHGCRDASVVVAAVSGSRSRARRILETAYDVCENLLGPSLRRADIDV